MIRTTTPLHRLAAAGVLVLTALAAPVYAQFTPTPVLRVTGKPTQFKVTVTKVELFNGSSFVTIFSGSATLDLVTASGATAFPGIANLTLPRGNYTQVRVTFTNRFAIRGQLSYLGVTWYVTSATQEGGAAANGSADSSLAGEASLLNPAWGALGDAVVQTITIPAVSVTPSTHFQPTLKFDVSNGLALWEMGGISHYLTLAPITISIQ